MTVRYRRVALAILGYGGCWLLPPLAAFMFVGILFRDAYDCSPSGVAPFVGFLGWMFLMLVAYGLTFGVVLAAADRPFMFRTCLVVGVLTAPLLAAAVLAPSGVEFCR